MDVSIDCEDMVKTIIHARLHQLSCRVMSCRVMSCYLCDAWLPACTPHAERMQRLIHEHQDRLRKLAYEKQQIMQRQAMWTGQVSSQGPEGLASSRPASALESAARRTERMALIQQLQDEQAACEAMLESLKQVCWACGCMTQGL